MGFRQLPVGTVSPRNSNPCRSWNGSELSPMTLMLSILVERDIKVRSVNVRWAIEVGVEGQWHENDWRHMDVVIALLFFLDGERQGCANQPRVWFWRLVARSQVQRKSLESCRQHSRQLRIEIGYILCLILATRLCNTTFKAIFPTDRGDPNQIDCILFLYIDYSQLVFYLLNRVGRT